MIPLVVIRPQPGCDATLAAAAGGAGLPAKGFPLFAIKPVAWHAPDPGTVDALLFGSVNALRHGGAALTAYRDKPAYAVGEVTARAARTAGFSIAGIGNRGLQDVLDRLHPTHRKLLRISGEVSVALDAPAGVTIADRVVYASEPQPMPDDLAELLHAPVVVMLHSSEAARHFAALCDDQAIPRGDISLVAISPRVAEAAGEGWKAVVCADKPDDTALLALAGQMCQEHVGAGHFQDGA